MRLRILFLVIANLAAFTALIYMFDIFGVVNYYTLMRDRISPVLPSFINKPKERIEDMYLLEKDDLEKMRLSFDERKTDLDVMSIELQTKSSNLASIEQEVQQEKDNLAIAWQTFEQVQEERNNYQIILEDLASKWSSMPPNATVAIITEHANNGEDQLIIDVLNQMDRSAAETGAQSITSFIISELDPIIAARILEKYEKRASPLMDELAGSA